MSGSTKPTGAAVEILAPVGVDGATPTAPGHHESSVHRLFDQLAGELVLRHVGGRRVLDLGHGAAQVTEWVKSRSASLCMVDAVDLGRGASVRLPFADDEFDVVYSLRTLAHLGHDAQSSHEAARCALREIARLLVIGGTALVQFDNALSLWGLYNGVKRARAVVERGSRVVEGPRGLTRFDGVRRVERMLPEHLAMKAVHGLNVLATVPPLLGVAVVRGIVRRFEWFARDRAALRRFGAHLLFVLRRIA